MHIYIYLQLLTTNWVYYHQCGISPVIIWRCFLFYLPWRNIWTDLIIQNLFSPNINHSILIFSMQFSPFFGVALRLKRWSRWNPLDRLDRLALEADNPLRKDIDTSAPYPSPATSGGIYAIRKVWNPIRGILPWRKGELGMACFFEWKDHDGG
jgi:hypothetical protein